MAAPNDNRTSFDDHHLQEEARKLRARLCRSQRLPYLRPHDDEEDGAHNVILRLLKAARKRKLSLPELLAQDPSIIQKALRAERSDVRRKRSKLAGEINAELEASLTAEPTVSEAQVDEMIEAVTQAVRLAPREREYLRLRLLGCCDHQELAAALGMTGEALSRTKYDVKQKLAGIPAILKETLCQEAHHEVKETPKAEGRGWRKGPHRRTL